MRCCTCPECRPDLDLCREVSGHIQSLPPASATYRAWLFQHGSTATTSRVRPWRNELCEGSQS